MAVSMRFRAGRYGYAAAHALMFEKGSMSEIITALDALRAGRMIILADDEARENEGDLVIAAEFVTAEAITFMARQACGLICLAMAGGEIDRLGLKPMAAQNNARWQSAFTVSIGARHGITTGISAADRAHTIRVAADANSTAQDIVSPGHVFPLRGHAGGITARQGHTEGSIELMRLVGLQPAAAICEIMNEDGSMARAADLKLFALKYGLPMISIRDIIAHLTPQESAVHEVA